VGYLLAKWLKMVTILAAAFLLNTEFAGAQPVEKETVHNLSQIEIGNALVLTGIIRFKYDPGVHAAEVQIELPKDITHRPTAIACQMALLEYNNANFEYKFRKKDWESKIVPDVPTAAKYFAKLTFDVDVLQGFLRALSFSCFIKKQ